MQKEIDIFYTAKRIRNLINEHKKFVYFSFLLIALISIGSFLYIRFNPEFVLNFQLKSKNIGLQEIVPFENELNYIIHNKSKIDKTNPLIDKISSSEILKISIDEIISDAAVLKNANTEAHYYEVKIFVKKEMGKEDMEDIKKMIVAYLKNRLNNSEILIQKNILDTNIKELSYIIDSTYIKKSQTGGNSYIIENMYKGLSDLQQLKSNNIYQSKFYEKENLILSDYPIILSNKIKYPWVIFLFGFVCWVISVSGFIVWKVLFPKNETTKI